MFPVLRKLADRLAHDPSKAASVPPFLQKLVWSWSLKARDKTKKVM